MVVVVDHRTLVDKQSHLQSKSRMNNRTLKSRFLHIAG
jgi:hypothetical protein